MKSPPGGIRQVINLVSIKEKCVKRNLGSFISHRRAFVGRRCCCIEVVSHIEGDAGEEWSFVNDKI
jgi:hypothetical protein